jgi:16S rRNA processing protein RimM
MRVCVGQILGAHGVRGLVKLASFTADPAAVAAYGPLTDEQEKRSFDVTLSALQKGHWMARIDGVSTREAAQALTGTKLYVDRAKLPPPDADEFYHADLIGLRADLSDGSRWGQIAALHNFGAGDILEIALASGGQAMLPFTHAAVPVIDIANGRVVVTPPTETGGESKE